VSDADPTEPQQPQAAQPQEQPPPAAQEQQPSVADLQARNAELDDQRLRARADLENYRKRSARELDRRVGEQRDAMLRDWLEAVDSVERALRMTPDAEGLRAVLAQMEAILARYGVVRAGAPGEPFDPERHEAIGVQEDGDGQPPRIADVARSGFTMGDRVLRPAQVIVTRG
jgi:molecular chaperone GrpE